MNAQHMSLRPPGQSSGLKPPSLLVEISPPGTGASLRQKLLPSAVPTGCVSLTPTGNAGAVLEHLKRLSDRMTEENESTRQDVTTYREKLVEAQATLSRTEQDLARERQENVVLRAKAKDDETQVAYVLEKMKLLTAIQDSIRTSIDTTKCDIGRVDQSRRDLDVKLLGQNRDFGDVQMALHAVTATRDQLAAELRRAQGLASDLKSHLRQAAEDAAQKDAALERHALDAAAKERAAEAHASSLQASLAAAMADLTASRAHIEQLRQDLEGERSRSTKATTQLTERYHEAQQRIMELDRQLCTAHNEQKAAREQILKLELHSQGLTRTASCAREELANLQATLADRTSELKNAMAEAEQLGHHLEVVRAEVAGREADIHRLAEEGAEAAKRADDLVSQEASLREELSARIADVVRLGEELTAERARAKLQEDELKIMIAAAQSSALADAARAASAIATAEQWLRESERAAEARLERFKERTSRENDEMRRRVRAEAEAEAKRLAEELKKATTALLAAESLAANNAAERESIIQIELQELKTSTSLEISDLKRELAVANQRVQVQAQDIKAQYERDLAAACASAQEETIALRLKLESEYHKEREEWEKEMEALTAAERNDAEGRMREAIEGLRAELGAKSEVALRDAAAAADKRRCELEEELKELAARVQELESGSTVGDQALAVARERAAQLEQQLTIIQREVPAAQLYAEAEVKCLRDRLEQQRALCEEREREWETQRCRLQLENGQSCKDWCAKEKQLRCEIQKLADKALEAQRQLEQERERKEHKEREWLGVQEQLEAERKRCRDVAEEHRRELEHRLQAQEQLEAERKRCRDVAEERRQELERRLQVQEQLETERKRCRDVAEEHNREVERRLHVQEQLENERKRCQDIADEHLRKLEHELRATGAEQEQRGALDEDPPNQKSDQHRNSEPSKKGNKDKASWAGAREPEVHQPEASIAPVPCAPNIKVKDKDAMPPPPPPTVKAQPVAPHLRISATQGTFLATGTVGPTGTDVVRKEGNLRRARDELADLTTESEMDCPSQSQGGTVDGHAAKRTKNGGAEGAPFQMPAATKGGRFSLFKGMSMGKSVQTTTANAGGGNEVTSAVGRGRRKKGAGNPTSKRHKAARGGPDETGVMDLFAGMSPNPK